MGVWKHDVKPEIRMKVNERAGITGSRNQVIAIQTEADDSSMEVTDGSIKLLRSSLFMSFLLL